MTDVPAGARYSFASAANPAPVCFAVFLAILTLTQGLRLGGVPLPAVLPLSFLYIAIFRPQITFRALAIYGFVIAYILATGIRNALEPTGGIKDFLYVGVCVTSLLVSLSLSDIMESMDIVLIGKILLVVLVGETVLEFFENLNLLGVNAILDPVLKYWSSLNEASLFEGSLESRSSGTFGYATLAGLICYLLTRCVAIAFNKRWIIYLAIIPLVVTGARMTALLFFVWDVVIPILYSRRRKRVLGWIGAAVFVIALLVTFIPDIFGKVFIFAQFIQFNTLDLLMASDSIWNRFVGFQWALRHWGALVTTGGITAADFADYESLFFPVDSELVLRSMQFGVIGFASLCAMNLWQGYERRDADWWFCVFIVLGSSLTTSVTTHFIVFPFIILYNLVLKRARESYGNRRRTLTWRRPERISQL
jgi:hypothetical protein